MSVCYSSRMGYGFIVKCHELPTEKLEQFQESDYAFAIDAWDPDNSVYFFGLMMNAAEPGEYFMIPPVTSYNHEKFIEMMDEYKSFFPNQKSYMPHSYVLSCID